MLHAAAALGGEHPEIVVQCVSSEEDGGLGTFAELELDSAFDAALTGPGRSVWMRQMVLGPAPEYAVRSNAPVDLPYGSLALAATPL